MGLIDEALAYIDARKRALGRNVAEVVRDPSYLSQLFDSAKRPQERERARAQDEARLRSGGGLLGTSVMGVDKPTESPYFDAAMNAPMGLLGAIKVYHGSPHKFDKFDLSRMGTGEGAQAYGHGGYMAEAPKVATEYANKLTQFSWTPRKGEVQYSVRQTHPNVYKVEKWIGKDDPYYGPTYTIEPVNAKSANMEFKSHDDAQKWLEDNRYITPGAASKWNEQEEATMYAMNSPYLYEASLRWPDPVREASDPLGPQHFLDWDKPLSEQPESVRKAFQKQQAKGLLGLSRKIAKDFEENGPMGYSTGRFNEMLNEARTYGGYGPLGMNVWDELKSAAPNSGDLIAQLRSRAKGIDAMADTGEQIYRSIPGGDMAASSAWRKAGIPGIRYLDGGSRAAGQGTHNYVVFDDALIELLKRNSIPIGSK